MALFSNVYTNRGYLILIGMFAAVSVADIVTTLVAIKNGAVEMNPVANLIIHSPILLIATKCIGVLILMCVVNRLCEGDAIKTYPNIGYFGLALAVGITLGAVINNTLVLMSFGLI